MDRYSHQPTSGKATGTVGNITDLLVNPLLDTERRGAVRLVADAGVELAILVNVPVAGRVVDIDKLVILCNPTKRLT